jgi:hypothetical protein
MRSELAELSSQGHRWDHSPHWAATPPAPAEIAQQASSDALRSLVDSLADLHSPWLWLLLGFAGVILFSRSSWVPWLALSLVRRAAHRIPDRALAARCAHRFEDLVNGLPGGNLVMLAAAIYVTAASPLVRWVVQGISTERGQKQRSRRRRAHGRRPRHPGRDDPGT